MKFSWLFGALALLSSGVLAAADPKDKDDSKDEETLKPCTTRSPNTGSFFDINPVYLHPPDPQDKSSKDERPKSWHARGYDYGANFTLNFCGPVIEELGDVHGVDANKNVSAYYMKDGKTYSIGQQNDTFIFRGRKLVLEYSNGSPCGTEEELRHSGGPRKSSVISLLCERDPLAPKASVAFVGSTTNECSYFFEARSNAFCPAVNVEKQSLGPSGVFGVIAVIAVLVYLIGGVVYQRAVMQQTGWRQLPNHALWAGIFGFFRDIFIIVFSSCLRCIPGRKGQGRVTMNGTVARGRGRDPEDDNRLIDQLDEVWDD